MAASYPLAPPGHSPCLRGRVCSSDSRLICGNASRLIFVNITLSSFTFPCEARTIIYQLPTIIYQLSTINYHLSTTNYYLPTTNYHLSTTNYYLPTTNYHLSTTNYYLPTTNYHLPSINAPLPTEQNSASASFLQACRSIRDGTAPTRWEASCGEAP